ncbi:MAG: SDR family oxidoreductase [Luteolibacter sp.]
MEILLTGANGYIGLRLLPALLEDGHRVSCLVRDKARFPTTQFGAFLDDGRMELVEGDMLVPESLPEIGKKYDAAYYLLHSMGAGKGFEEREEACAKNFTNWLGKERSDRVIYLGGLVPDGELSEHLESRENVNRILRSSDMEVTTLRASIIVGSGSASFEIIRDLAEKLPVMLTPKWTLTRCQPIAVRNVIGYLTGCLGVSETAGGEFDIGGPEVLSYRSLLENYAEARDLKRWLIPVPFLTPGLSAHWLRLVTTTTMALAKSLIKSLHNETICSDDKIRELVPQDLLTYKQAIDKAFARIAQNKVPSSWIDSLSSGSLRPEFFKSIQVPEHGVLRDRQEVPLTAEREKVIDAVWSIGGKRGWPSMNWAWKVRGAMDRAVGGIGMRRGRRSPVELFPGDALDFWRVLLADRVSDGKSARLILSAEMKVPGEAWLDFEVTKDSLIQTATFRPRGLFGRVYWYSVLPFHLVLFPVMAKRLAAGSKGEEGRK